MDRIVTWADKFGRRSLNAHAISHPSFAGDRTPPAAGVSLAVKAVARVNSGRWIADCPTPGCGGAEYVDMDNPVFFCCECRNAPSGHQPIAVTVPDATSRSGIETALLKRPAPMTRNWRQPETVADLVDENAQMGVG